MANDSKIVITAGLQIPETVSTIKEDLGSVSKELNAKQALKVTCYIDTKNISGLQKQLSEASKNLKINLPKISTSGTSYTEILSANDIAQTEQNIVALANGMRTIEELKNKFSSDSTVKGISADWAKNAKGNLTGFAVNIKKATGEVEKFKYVIDRLKQVKLLGSTGSDRGVAKMQQDVAKLQKDLANFESSHKSIESGLTEPLKEARKAVDRFANGDGSVEEAQRALDNLKTAAANIGVSLKSLGASFNIFDNAVNKAKNFDNTLKSLQADINALSNESAKSTLSGRLAGATQSLAELQQIESTSGRGLEWSKKYGEVSLTIQEITNGLKAARKEEVALSRETSLSNKIKKLSADMQAYAAANKRAIDSTKQMSDGTTFMSKWEDLTSRMAKGSELSADELKHLGEEFRIFGKEAEAAGLKGNSAWQKFLKSFKVMSSYVTANMVFHFVKRQLRDMVNEVTAVDTAMTELRKVTEATDAEFEAFAISAGQTGRTLGASVSDVINATSTFSRAGYNLPDAEELGRIATLYKNVGDGIDIDSASESLISVMKAFNIEAEDSIRIIDKINLVSNRAAIDSGGLGLALQRVASAMDAANNSLDETIALTTASNEVVQNPETVAHGWRTVALRIRGAKTELEDAGLETDGMVESTAKLRDLIKGISGVDIMIDENNFKSTYQIISELGEVWDSISDINQASLLEAIAGKRQSNIVAAALNNYERLNEILEISENSAGSAMREQEEYAKSIQYSLGTLKAAYQDFSRAVVNSDFLKDLLGTAQSFLEVLTKIIDKFGTLPTILTGIAAIGGIKGIGIFGNLNNGLATLSQNFDKIKQVANYDFGSLYKKYNIDIKGLGAKDINALQNYINLLGAGKTEAEAFAATMGNATQAAKAQTINFNRLNLAYQEGKISQSQYATATQNLALTQKTATATSKALSIALNTLANIGIMVAINLAIKGISALADKMIITKEELDEFRESAITTVDELSGQTETFAKESEKVGELLTRYQEIATSVEQTAESKETLTSIQQTLVDMYGEEAAQLDLVNGKYDENIAKVKELSQASYDEWKRENAAKLAQIDQMQNYNVGWVTENGYGNLETPEGYRQTFLKGIVARQDELAASLYVVKDVSEDIESIYKEIAGVEFTDGFFSNDLYLSGTLEDAKKQLGEILDKARDLGYSSKTLKPLEDRYIDIRNVLQEISDITNTLNQIEPPRPLTLEDWLDANGIEESAEQAAIVLEKSADEIRTEWFESLGEMQKESLSNIDKMKSALQTVAGGGTLSGNDFWALAELDTDRILNDVKLVNGQFQLNNQQLIQFKDAYISKQVDLLKAENADLQIQKAKTDELVKQATLEVQAVSRRNLAIPAYRQEYESANNKLRQVEQASKAYGDSIKRNNLLIRQLNSSLGNTVDTQKVIKAEQDALNKKLKALNNDVAALNKAADNFLKAQEYRIDEIVDGFEAEQEALEKDKELLEEQLATLEKQEEELEKIISNYETVADVVGSTISSQIEEIKDSKSQIEEYYNNLISKLKEENDERELALDYAEKLAALENAKNNRVRTYSSSTGWTYEINKEALTQAQNALAQADSEKAIKALEKERDSAIGGFDDQIKALENYVQQWKDIKDEERIAEEKRLADQILGAEWRTRINEQDISLLNKYRTEYRKYNTQLKTLTNTEMAMMKQSIEAKNKEIAAKKEQIDAWNKYKSEVQKAVNEIKAANDGYLDMLDQVTLDENSDYYDREVNLWNFKEHYKSYMDEIAAKNWEIEQTTERLQELADVSAEIVVTTNIPEVSEEMANFIDSYRDAIESMQRSLDESLTGYGVVNSAWDARLAAAANALRRGYASGGVADYTGLAMLHGTKNASETIFNAAQSKSLYDMVASGSFSAQVADRAYAGVASAIKNISTNSNNNTNSIHVDNININGVQQPHELKAALQREFGGLMKDYWKTKKTESQIY